MKNGKGKRRSCFLCFRNSFSLHNSYRKYDSFFRPVERFSSKILPLLVAFQFPQKTQKLSPPLSPGTLLIKSGPLSHEDHFMISSPGLISGFPTVPLRNQGSSCPSQVFTLQRSVGPPPKMVLRKQRTKVKPSAEKLLARSSCICSKKSEYLATPVLFVYKLGHLGCRNRIPC